MKRHGLPLRRSVRYLLAKPLAKGGHGYHWNPAGRDVKAPGRPDWLKPTSLGRDLAAAIVQAETLNARLDAWRATGENGRAGTIAGIVTAYLASTRFARLAERTRQDYRHHLDAIRADMGDARPDDVTPPVVARYQEHLARKGVRDRQAAYRVVVLRLLFAWAIRQGHARGPNPVSRPEIRKAAPRSSTWTPAQLAAMWQASPCPARLAMALALYTLQRQGDVLAMTWDAWDGRSLRFVQRKTGKRMALPVHPRLGAMLRIARRTARGATIVATCDGGRYTEAGFRAIWARPARKVAAATGCAVGSFHDLRRTAATWLSAGGVSDAGLRGWTGHGRRGEDAILDVYALRHAELATAAFPAMNGWRLGRVRSSDSFRRQGLEHASRTPA